MNRKSTRYPVTKYTDILRLLRLCVVGLARGPRSFDFGLVLHGWISWLIRRHRSENFILNLHFSRLLVVTGRELSEHILAQPPDMRGYAEGKTKVRAMSFLAEQALTITHGEKWRRLRRINEAVLSVSDTDGRMQFVLDGVHKAFPGPVSDKRSVRRCMAEAMRLIVFGPGGAPAQLTEDVQTLFSYVQSPGKRILFGWKEAGRRKRLYDTLRRLWRESSASDTPSLIETAKRMAHHGIYSEEELLQQIPHWMFTFTGSGTDLLARTLGMVVVRNKVYARVRAEIAAQGSTSRASSVMNMTYIEACLLETCRLFPPVTRTFHTAPRGDTFKGMHIPAGMELLHYFTARQRDLSVDATANDFRPERWLEAGSNAAAIYPSLFLGGARSCPGKGLILFVCKAAIALLLKDGRMQTPYSVLSTDPLPYSFPERGMRFSMAAQ